MSVKIEKMALGGLGLARDEKGVVFVEGAYTGDRITLSGTTRKRGTRFAQVKKFESTQLNRRDSDCANWPACGGCYALDLEDHERFELKKSMFIEALERAKLVAPSHVGKTQDSSRAGAQHSFISIKAIDLVTPQDSSPHRFQGARRARLSSNDEGDLGFREKGSRTIVDVESCARLAKPLSSCIAQIKNCGVPSNLEIRILLDAKGDVHAALKAPRNPDFREALETWASDLCAQGVLKNVLFELDQSSSVELNEHRAVLKIQSSHSDNAKPEPRAESKEAPSSLTTYDVDAGVFAQSSDWAAEQICTQVQKSLRDHAPTNPKVLELFSGCGEISFACVGESTSWLGVEGAARSVMHANATLGRSPYAMSKLSFLQTWIDADSLKRVCTSNRFNTLILDPPREGFKDIMSVVQVVNAACIIMVSCDPATAIREAKTLMQNNYTCSSLCLIDAFPRSTHLESIWTFTLTNS